MFSRLVKINATTARVVVRNFAEAPAAGQLTLNFTTPATALHVKKVVDKVIIPGAAGEYGVTAGHSPIISELKAGVVQVVHVGGEIEKYFVAGGFALTHPNSVTDVSVPEAFPLSEFDESAVKSGHSEAQKAFSSSAEGSAGRAAAQIQIDTYVALARALGVAL